MGEGACGAFAVASGDGDHFAELWQRKPYIGRGCDFNTAVLHFCDRIMVETDTGGFNHHVKIV